MWERLFGDGLSSAGQIALNIPVIFGVGAHERYGYEGASLSPEGLVLMGSVEKPPLVGEVDGVVQDVLRFPFVVFAAAHRGFPTNPA